MWQRHEMSKCCWKNGAKIFAQCKLSICKKKNKNKKTKQYLQSSKQSAIKQGMSVFISGNK